MTTTTLVMAALVALAGGALYRRAPASLAPAVRRGLADAARVGLRLPFALVFAGFAAALLPQPWVVAGLGAESGWRGLVAATLAGALVPGGPFVVFPLALGLAERGAALPPLIALVSAWSLLGVNRIVVFELPVLGARFVLLRVAVAAPLPALARRALIPAGVPAATTAASRPRHAGRHRTRAPPTSAHRPASRRPPGVHATRPHLDPKSQDPPRRADRRRVDARSSMP